MFLIENTMCTVIVAKTLLNTLILTLKMGEQLLHGRLFPQQGRLQAAKTPWTDPMTRLR